MAISERLGWRIVISTPDCLSGTSAMTCFSDCFMGNSVYNLKHLLISFISTNAFENFTELTLKRNMAVVLYFPMARTSCCVHRTATIVYDFRKSIQMQEREN
jgi:hypothetical protein